MNLKEVNYSDPVLLAAAGLGLAAGLCGGYILGRKRSAWTQAIRLEDEIAATRKHYEERTLEEAGRTKDYVQYLENQVAGKNETIKVLSEVKEEYDGQLSSELAAEQCEFERKLGIRRQSATAPIPGSDPRLERLSGVGDDEDPRLEGLSGVGDDEEDGESALDTVVPEIPGEEEPPEEAAIQRMARSPSKPYEITQGQFGEFPGWQVLSITYYAGDKVLTDDKDQPIRDVLQTVGPISDKSFGHLSGDASIRLVRNERLQIDFEVVLNQGSYADVILNYGNPSRRE